MRSPKKLIVLDLNNKRLELAKKFGADIVLNPNETDCIAEIMNIIEGYGYDIYIEATGAPASVIRGLQIIRKLGRFVEFSVFGTPTTYN